MKGAILMEEEYWMNSHFSIARHYGRVRINDLVYIIVNKEGKDLFECSYEAEKAGREKAIESGEPADLLREDFRMEYRKLGRDRFIEILKEYPHVPAKLLKKLMREESKKKDDGTKGWRLIPNILDEERALADFILSNACELFGVDVQSLRSAERKMPLPLCRCMITKKVLGHTQMSHLQISELINRKHPMVSHYMKVYDAEITYNKNFRTFADELERRIELYKSEGYVRKEEGTEIREQEGHN